MRILVYALFLVSGAAALVYEVTWARALGLVFGSSHVAVATVLAVFMGGLALGGKWLGPAADRTARPLRWYGLLELGIGASAALFLGLMSLYPRLYPPIASWADDRPGALTAARMVFAAAGMAVPTILMGATLPALARLARLEFGPFDRALARLYAVNTLGAVAGTLLCGFVLLEAFGVGRSQAIAIAANAAVGVASLILSRWRSRRARVEPAAPARNEARGLGPTAALWGIALSGFCALGYEVLWTRLLSIVVGTSVYGFTIMLAAFLFGIAAGGAAYSWVAGRDAARRNGAHRTLAFLAILQIGIGATALGVTVAMRDLPGIAIALQELTLGGAPDDLAGRSAASFILAFLLMAVPAALMGMAFPAACSIRAGKDGEAAGAVGEALAYNTVGAILGSAVSGFVLVTAFGSERSLQLLVALNLVAGFVLLALETSRRAARAASLAAAALAAALWVADPGWLRFWDESYLAVFRNNQREQFRTEERRRRVIENTEVVYWHEGVNESISVIRVEGGLQGFVVNGRVEASNARMDRQCQYTLGHLPMLLHPRPRDVFVLGLGTGMTLGATSVHPEVETLTLAEIEPGVLGVARAFEDYNHRVLDDPALEIVFNDGRNYLATTDRRFDVITADPIHPWSGGAAYLYTREYFRLAASRLRPGGVMTQWLPIYELTDDDLRTVVATFLEAFPHAMLWLTYYDAELVGSLDPIVLDPDVLEGRIGSPEIRSDLVAVEMGSAEEFLSYFVMGAEGLRGFAAGAAVNTDDNLHLEFSAPRSMGVGGLAGRNVRALARHREGLRPYLRETDDRWDRLARAGALYDGLHARALLGRWGRPAFDRDLLALLRAHPDYAPSRYLDRMDFEEAAKEPRPVGSIPLAVVRPSGKVETIRLTAVFLLIGERRGLLVFADGASRTTYGESELAGPARGLPGRARERAGQVLGNLASTVGAGPPANEEALRRALADALRQVESAPDPR